MMPPSSSSQLKKRGTSAPTDSPRASRESHSYFGGPLPLGAQATSRSTPSVGGRAVVEHAAGVQRGALADGVLNLLVQNLGGLAGRQWREGASGRFGRVARLQVLRTLDELPDETVIDVAIDDHPFVRVARLPG